MIIKALLHPESVKKNVEDEAVSEFFIHFIFPGVSLMSELAAAAENI